MLAPILDISAHRHEGLALIVCRGEFDMTTAESFRDVVDSTIAHEPAELYVDCSHVTFIDSVGMRALLHTSERCRDEGIVMTADLSRPVLRLFDAVGSTRDLKLAS